MDETIAAGATRAEVMALATAALDDPDYTLDGKLTHLYEQGKLYPAGSGQDSTVSGALIIFWAPNDNDTDNLYNANNGQIVSDFDDTGVNQLHIDFGVKLEATQLMYENDSFGNTYDKFTGFQPTPSVNNYITTINATTGVGGAADAITLDASYQFRPTESADDADLSEYLYYKADFVVSADKDVPADSIMLAGYYKAWCGPNDDPEHPSWNINNGNWFGLVNDGMDVAAGEQIRLIEGLGSALGGSVAVHYKDLVDYGNDGIGFLCGAKDLTGENAGTTLTVTLNLYETTYNPNTGEGDKYVETGVVIPVGTFTYTFDGLGVNSADELKTAISNNVSVIKLNEDLALDADETIAIGAGKDVTLNLNGKTITTVSDGTSGNRNAFDVNGGKLTVENGTITTKHEGANMGWGSSTNVFNVTNGGVLNIKDAIIENLGGSDMAFGIHLNNWGEVTLNIENSTIKSTYMAVRVFNSGNDMNNVTIKDSTLEATGYCFWVHNYTEADFGTQAKADHQKTLLNFDIFNGTNTFITGKNFPVRYGFTNALEADANGNVQ